MASVNQLSFADAFVAVFRAIGRQIKSIATLTGVLIAVFAGIALCSANPLATLFKLVSVAGIVLMLLSIGAMILTFNKATEVEPVALLAALVVVLLGTMVTLRFTYGRPTPAVMLLSLLAGGVLGFVWSRTSAFFIVGRRIRMKGSIWSLAVWALTLALNQAVVLVIGHAPTTVICLALTGAGVTAGNTVGLLLRARRAAALLAGADNHA